jgi:histone H3/H4
MPSLKKGTVERIIRSKMKCRISVRSLDFMRGVLETYLNQLIDACKKNSKKAQIPYSGKIVLREEDVKNTLSTLSRSYKGSKENVELLQKYFSKSEIIDYFEQVFSDVEPAAQQLILEVGVGFAENLALESCKIVKHVKRNTVRVEDIIVALKLITA